MKIILLVTLALTFAGCATGSGPTPEQIAAYEKLIHQTVQDGAQDYKTIKKLGTPTTSVHWEPNGEINQANPPFLVNHFGRTYTFLTEGL